MNNPIQELLDVINEGGSSMIRRSKASKRAALAGGNVRRLAKKDPMQIKYDKLNKQRLKLKATLKKKYASRAKSLARKQMR